MKIFYVIENNDSIVELDSFEKYENKLREIYKEDRLSSPNTWIKTYLEDKDYTSKDSMLLVRVLSTSYETISAWNSLNQVPKIFHQLIDDSDLDWIVFVPKSIDSEYISWLSGIDSTREPKKIEIIDRGTLFLGYH